MSSSIGSDSGVSRQSVLRRNEFFRPMRLRSDGARERTHSTAASGLVRLAIGPHSESFWSRLMIGLLLGSGGAFLNRADASLMDSSSVGPITPIYARAHTSEGMSPNPGTASHPRA